MAKSAPRSHNSGTCVEGLIAAMLPLFAFLGLCALWPAVIQRETFEISWPWMPSLDLALRFRLDGLGLLFGLIVTGVGFFVTLYAASYMAANENRGRFFVFLQAFMLSMLGIITADNLLLMFIFWEATTVLSYLLIGFDHESSNARDSARQGILITGGGGLALLIGILLLKAAGGSFTLSDWMTGVDSIREHRLYPLILVLMLLGAMTKSAQVPFHFWLPNAMSAPTPISAFLHAATMVKAGIYLLMRLHPLLGGTPLWMGSLVLIGGTTALWGAIQALTPNDLKKVLAYTTIMGLGILTMFIGGDNTASLTAAATFLLVHALYKAALFLSVGNLDYETGTRDRKRLGGLWRKMPVTALAVIAATMSMAGFPLFFGFVGKEIMYAGALAEETYPLFATTIALLANALMTAVAGFLLLGPFGGKPPDHLARVHEPSWTMLIGPAFLGGLCLLFGLIPWWVSEWLIQPAVHSFYPHDDQVQLSIFHGFNMPLLLSLLTLTLGAIIYHWRRPLSRFVSTTTAMLPVTTDGIYRSGLDGFAAMSVWVIRQLQNGSLYRYLLTIITVFTLATIGMWWVNANGWIEPPQLPSLPFAHWLLVTLMTAAIGAVVTARSRILAVGALGVVGSGAALLFLMYGAPDLALTQLLVETLTLIIVSIILLRLPPLSCVQIERWGTKGVNLLVAASTGALITTLSLATTRGHLDRQLTDFFERHSAVTAHGRNIVNVILVDFRALDTLGEITVVATAGLAGMALLVKKRR